ncbi:hypothetical protein HYV57_01300 [Candidatus Peregrinibacteria bacterium]|nr:hypothetical protein [Candidatus Peregrinibacteria bacterium]
MDEKLMAKRILNKQCPYCENQDIAVNWTARRATCNSCGKSMRKEEAERILRRAEVTL